jgi:hypothetical protein
VGALKKFEQRLEGFVNGAFAKVFKSEVQPVEIAGALQRECDNNASIWNRDRTVVPNDFIVELSPHDHERLSPYSGQLGTELAGMVREYAQAQRYSFMGPLNVQLERADDLDTGLYRVRSRIQANEAAQGRAPQAPAQAQPPPPPTAARRSSPGSRSPPRRRCPRRPPRRRCRVSTGPRPSAATPRPGPARTTCTPSPARRSRPPPRARRAPTRAAGWS